MSWGSFISLTAQGRQATKSRGKAPPPPPPEPAGGVGPWAGGGVGSAAFKQGQIPETFLARYLRTGSVFSQVGTADKKQWTIHAGDEDEKKRAPADERQRTSLTAQLALGNRGNKREGVVASLAEDYSIDAGIHLLEVYQQYQQARQVGQTAQTFRTAQQGIQAAKSAAGAAQAAQQVGQAAQAGQTAQQAAQAAEAVEATAQAAQAAQAAKAVKEAAQAGAATQAASSAINWSGNWVAAVVMQIINAGVHAETYRKHKEPGESTDLARWRGVLASEVPFKSGELERFQRARYRVARSAEKRYKRVEKEINRMF
jgi:hypothetical protein